MWYPPGCLCLEMVVLSSHSLPQSVSSTVPSSPHTSPVLGVRMRGIACCFPSSTKPLQLPVKVNATPNPSAQRWVATHSLVAPTSQGLPLPGALPRHSAHPAHAGRRSLSSSRLQDFSIAFLWDSSVYSATTQHSESSKAEIQPCPVLVEHLSGPMPFCICIFVFIFYFFMPFLTLLTR